MAFVRVICKARKIEKLRRELEDEKMKSFEASQGNKPQYSIKQRYRHFWIDLRSKIIKWLRRMCTFPKHSCMYRTVYKAKRDGTCENFTLKSIVGFIGGFFLTYIFFMFFVFILNFKLSTATIMCSFFGSILTIGLAFSYKVRCVVFLLLPQFFSKRGRQALMAYAFILAITGPAKNTLHNMGILSESLACGQEQLKAAVRQIIDVVKKPFYAIRDAIKSVVKTVKVIVKKIKEVLLTIKRIIMAILRVIKAAFQFLGKILSICNKELGTPFERCTRVFEGAITDCHAKLGPLFSWLCSITYLVQAVCYIVKIFDFICMIIDFISDSIIGVVVRKVKIFVRHIRTMFYVRIKFSHSFHFETNQSKSMSEITTGIVTEIRHRTENILAVFDFMSCATSLFFLFIILRVLHYRYKFLTSERFDNRFITRNFREIDMRRAQLEKETVLPLNHRERTLYITVTSIRLVKSEKVKLSKAAVVLGMTTIKLSTHMMADYALYWVLTVIRYHARFQSTVQAPNVVGLHIEGEGFIAKLLKSIVKAFQPLGVKLEIDTVPCLPDPIPPDYDRYVQIASLLILCWILTIFEPYGLRLRHSVMCFYHPTRARQRAVWLYNHIMRSRSSFLKFARRQLRRKVTGAKGITKITFKEYLRANIKFKWFRLCLGSDKQDACLLCGEVFRETDQTKPIRCIKPGCPGIYCEQCFADLQNLCTVCMEPIQYGDLSDISEEKDSSADEALPSKKKKKRKKNKCTLSKCLKRKDDEDSDDEERGLLQTRPGDLQESEKSDSDYSTGGATDNSYSYQHKKDLTSEPQDPSTPKFRDVEKQKVPNYAYWHSYVKDDSEIEPDSDDSSTDWRQTSESDEEDAVEEDASDSSKIDPDSDDNREDLEKFLVGPHEENTVEQSASDWQIKPDSYDDRAEKSLEMFGSDKENAVDEDSTSTSHSSLLSELQFTDPSAQISVLQFREGSKETFRLLDNKIDDLQLPQERQQKGDVEQTGSLSSTSHSSLLSELQFTDPSAQISELPFRESSKETFQLPDNKIDDPQLPQERQQKGDVEQAASLSSSSHSSLLSELKFTDPSAQISELPYRESSKETFQLPDNKIDNQGNQLLHRGVKRRQQKGDIEQGASWSSTSHSTPISEMQFKDISPQTSESKFREGSKETYTLPYDRTDEDRQRIQILYRRGRRRQQKGDIEQGASWSSTSHSSPISELQFKDASPQTSELKFREGSKETSTLPYGRTDEDGQKMQLLYRGSRGRQKKGDVARDASLSSSSHSSLISELQFKDRSSQTSKLQFRKDSMETLTHPYKIDDDHQGNQLPCTDIRGRQQKGDVAQDASLPSSSHSSPLSELQIKDLSPQTSELQVREGTKETKEDKEKQLLHGGIRKEKQQADGKFWQTDVKFIFPEKRLKNKSKQEKGNGIQLQHIKNTEDQDYDETSISSEKSTNILILPCGNNKQKTDKCKIPHRGIATNYQYRLVESCRNANRQQENIPLTDRPYHPFSSESTYESPLSKARRPGVSSETETTFIETPKKTIPFQSRTSSSLDSEIRKCQKCGKSQHIPVPRLNLNFDSPISSDSITSPTPPSVIDRFRQNVRYEIIQETPSTTSRSNTSGASSVSPRSPININYQIYVPGCDTFLDRTDLVSITTGQKPKDGSYEKEKDIAKQISEYKHIQRQKRKEDIARNKKFLPENLQSNTALNEKPENAFNAFFTSIVDSTVTKQSTSCVQEIDNANKSHPNNPESSQNNTDAYKIKVKDYYKEINRKQPTDNPIVTKDQNKLVKFIRRIFRKAKNETALSKSPKSKFLLKESDNTFVILSPKLTEGASSAEDDNSGIIGSTSTSGDEFLNQTSTGTSTRSSSSSFMGSSASHIRGGAETKVGNSEQSVTSRPSEITTTEVTTSEITPTTTTTDTSQRNDNVASSDSEISEVDIFFGRSAKYRKRKLGNSKESTESDSRSPNSKIDRLTSASKAKTDGTQMNLNNTQNNSTYPGGSTPRYSRQPAERDQDPRFQGALQMVRYPLTPDVENCWCGNTEPNKIMSDPYTTSEISPGYIERGRCCTYPCTSPKHTENYNSSNQSPNNNKAMCVRYPSNEENLHYIGNVRRRCYTCPGKPQENYNMEMMHEPYPYPNPPPRLPPCYANEVTRERRPMTGTPQECCNKNRSSSEERRRYSPAVRFSRSTETSAQIVREYNGPCRPPTSVCCNCPPCTPKIDEIRGRAVEYSGGEPNNGGPPTKENYSSNSATYRNNPEDDQYPDSYCGCNTYEVSGADPSPIAEDDQGSYCSGCSGRSKYPDLVYQNTDEFFELVNELGDTLSQRNKERVQKTMREFEIKSSQNKNLDKPIVFESDTEEINERHPHCHAACNHCHQKKHAHQHQAPGTKFTRVETRRESLTRCTNRPPKYGYVEKVVHHMDRNVDSDVERQPKCNKRGSNTHWQLNTRTGEWYKAYDDYYEYDNEYYNVPPSPPPPRQVCVCERSPRRYYSRNCPERQMGNYVPPPPRSGKCNNCGFSRDSAY